MRIDARSPCISRASRRARASPPPRPIRRHAPRRGNIFRRLLRPAIWTTASASRGCFRRSGKNAMLQQADPTGLEHLILAGTRIGVSASRPSPLAMPSFAWKLTDQEIADVSTYIRNSWGNQAAPVSASDVRVAQKN